MPTISEAQSEIIKRQLFCAREHLQCLGVLVAVDVGVALEQIARASYEFNRALKISAVKHVGSQPASRYYDDALTNFFAVIDFDLTQIEIDPDAVEEAVAAATEISCAVRGLPLSARPAEAH